MFSISDLSPEEQETKRKSKDPSIIMTANGTTHTTEEVTVFVYDLDMSVQVQLLKESPTVLSLGKVCEPKRFLRMSGIQVSHHIYLINNGRTIECKTDNHIPLVVPGVPATGHQTHFLGNQKQTRAVGDHEFQVETELPERLQPFTE